MRKWVKFLPEPSAEMIEKARILCETKERKCITNKCPLYRLGCYHSANFATFYMLASPRVRKRAEAILAEI